MQGARPGFDARRLAAGVVQVLFFLAFPLIVWLGYTNLGTRALGGLLIGLYAVAFLVRGRGSAKDLPDLARRHIPLVLLVLLAMLTGSRVLLLFVPMLVSLYLFFTFAASLRSGTPMIERFARIVEDDLPDFCVPYCRTVTRIWCAFLAANSLCVGALALWAPIGWWTLYAGLVFYLLMGALLVAEFVVRKLWFRYYGDGLMDRIFARCFPPEQTANGRRSLAYVEARLSRPSV